MLNQCPQCHEPLSETADSFECTCGFSLNKVFVPFLPIHSIEHIEIRPIEDDSELSFYGIGSC